MSDFESTALVLADHEVFRRVFTALDELTGADVAGAWGELEAKLEVHAVAEEEVSYPLLAQEVDSEQETVEGVHDHKEIRHAVAEVADHEVGSDGWWGAVHTARQVNTDHMAEEETDSFPPFRDVVDDEQREALGMCWLAFHERERADGLSGEDAVVAEVVAPQVPEGAPSIDGT